MSKLTVKQEKFAQKYIELGNASEAYRQSYDAENMKTEVIHVKACELLKSGNVAVRVLELKDIHAKAHAVTVESLVKELEEARAMALEEKQASPAVSATMGKAKLHGLGVENVDHKSNGETLKGLTVGFAKPDDNNS